MRDCVGGVMIEMILSQGDIGSGGRDQMAGCRRPPNAIQIRMVRVGSANPEQGQGDSNHRYRENKAAYQENAPATWSFCRGGCRSF